MKKYFRKVITIMAGFIFAVTLLSCMSTAEREQRRQWELEGRNPRTGLFDEPFSGRSFQEREYLEAFLETEEYQRAFENYQRFLARRAEHQRQIDAQNRLIDAENAEINRRNAEIDRQNAERERLIREHNAWVIREHQAWARYWENRVRGGVATGRYTRLRLHAPSNSYIGSVTVWGIRNGREVIVFQGTRDFSPQRPFPPRQQRLPTRSRVQNTMIYDPRITY